MSELSPIPDGYPRLTPYLAVDDAGAAIDFYTGVFGARERMRLPMPDGGIGHCELEVGDSLLMLADEAPEMGAVGPRTVGGTPVTVMIYVEDVDQVFQAALDAGAEEISPPTDQFYGDRTASIADPFGHRWSIQTRIEDVPPDEMQRRMEQLG